MDLKTPKLFDVKGQVALVTGGGSGLGEMMATSLVQNGAKVFIASRKEKQLKEVAERLTKQGPGSCEYIIADISSKKGCDALADELKKRTDHLTILVNNSGTTWGAPYDNFPEAGWRRVLATNIEAIFYLTAAVTPLLEKKATPLMPGRVVNISSIAGFEAKTEGSGLSAEGMGLWSYNTSKAGANALTRQLAVTLGKRNITVNAICPGVYPSKMTKYGLEHDTENLMAKSRALSQLTYNVARFADSTLLRMADPMGRIGAPEDIAGLLLFLVSRAGSHVSGNCIMTDGGSYLAGGGYTTPAKL
ncbi:hypothetical protein OIO90_005079 [Microbotryomycetes sp. JL221]|nr:hypothetical protein OIO90_005079 [Microbotryomycetes sp. JL221]